MSLFAMCGVQMRAALTFLFVLVAAALVPAGLASAAQVPVAAGAGDVSSKAVPEPTGTEVPSLESARSRTWVKADGKYETRIYQRPVNVRDANGDWKLIDNTLSRTASGGLTNGAGDSDLALPATLDGAVKLTDGDDWLKLTLKGAADNPATVDDTTATYPAVGAGVDAKLSSDDGGLKEDLVLSSAKSQNMFSYDVALSDGLSLKSRKDGGIDVVKPSGAVAFALAAPLAVDAKGAVAPGSAASMSVDGSTITVSLDESWLAAPDRAFPVDLDPSATTGAVRDCYLDGANTTTSYCSSADLWAGTSAGHDHKAILDFDLAGCVPAAAFIESAWLDLYPNYQTSPGVSKNLSAHRLTNDFDNSATWIKRTSTLNWATPGGDINPADLDSQPVPASGTWSSFQITDAVNDWLTDPTTNHGLAVTDDGSTANNSVVYASSDGPTSAHDPYLDIEYYGRTGAKSNYTMISQQISARSSLGVNVAGGNLMLSSSDLQVASTGLPVSINRYYNSLDPWSGLMGSKGRLGIGNDIVLYQCDAQGSRCLDSQGGVRERFVRNPTTGAYTTPQGLGNVTLTRAGLTSGRFTLTDNVSGVAIGFYDNSYAYMDSITDRHGNSLTLQNFGSLNALSKITDMRSRDYNLLSNASGNITKISVPTTVISGGVDWKYGYTGNQLTTVTDPESNVTTYTYQSGTDLLTKIHDPRGNDTNITYNTAKQVESITRYVDGVNDAVTLFFYPTTPGSECNSATGVVGETNVVDPNNNLTQYCWNQAGQVVKTIDDAGNTTSNTYNSQGNSTLFSSFYGGTSALANTTTTFDPSGQNPTSSTDPSGAATTIGYPASPANAAAAAHPTSITEPNKNATSGAKNVTNYTWDPTTYDLKTVKANASGFQATLAYYADGQVNTATDGNGNTTTYVENAKKEISEIDPQPLTPVALGKTLYTYDGLSRVATVTTGYLGAGTGKTQTFTYDTLDQVKSVVDSDGQTTTFSYDGDGNLTSRVTAGTQTSSYVYDKLNRKTSETFPGSITNTYTYDLGGNLATLTDASGTVTYGYDDLNRVTSIQSPKATSGTDTTSIVYTDPSSGGDPSHSSSLETLPGGGTIKYTDDLAGKLTELLVKNSSAAQTARQTYGYTASIAGTTTSGELLYNIADYGTGTTPVTSTTYTYGDNDELLDRNTVNGTGGSNVRHDQFTYDNNGNRTVRVSTIGAGAPGTTTQAYNGNNELCWSYAAASANTCASPPTGATSYTHDASGGQTTGGAANFAWDARGRLKTIGTDTVTSLSPNNGELTAIGTSTFQNTVLGVNRVTVGGNLTQIVRNPGNASAISQIAAGTKEWFVTDQLGSTAYLIDSTGNVQRTYTYTVEGKSSNTGTGPDTPITYAGGHDIGNGLIHFGARYYQPNTGRWTQPDPLNQADDLSNANPYLYAGSDSINGTDPTGLIAVHPCVFRCPARVRHNMEQPASADALNATFVSTCAVFGFPLAPTATLAYGVCTAIGVRTIIK